MKTVQPGKLHILLADDDNDDRFFFAKALDALTIQTSLETVENGELLISRLLEKGKDLPDVLFLDLNMPKKNGAECLSFIKAHQTLKRLPVIIYSTSLHTDITDLLYESGADYYVRKTEFPLLKAILRRILPLISKRAGRPSRAEFVFGPLEV